MGVVRISLYNLRFADTSEERYGVIENSWKIPLVELD